MGDVDGLLHNEESSWEQIVKCKTFSKGDEVEVKIIKIDREKRIFHFQSRDSYFSCKRFSR